MISFEPVALAVRDEVGDARHRPVLVHDLADDAGRVEARRAARGRPRPRSGPARSEHAAVACAQREDVARLDEVARPLRRVDRDLDRARAVGGRDPGRDALAGLDRDGERGAERRLVVLGHLAQAELVAALLGQRRGRSGRARAWP